MKFNRFLLIGMLLIIVLTAGAAAASENATQNSTAMSESDDIALESDSTDVLANSTYYDGELYVYVDENYTNDKEEWSYSRLMYLNSNQEANNQSGTFRVFVDDAERMSFNITDGYFDISDTGFGGEIVIYNKFIYPQDLGIEDCGTYNIKVKFNETSLVDTMVTMKEREDFDILVHANPYYCEREYLDFSTFLTVKSNHFNNGTLEIFVNGTRKVAYVVSNGSFEHIEVFSDRIRYVKPSDVFDDYGTFNVIVNFTENAKTKTLVNETVLFGEYEPVTDPKIEVSLEFDVLTLPADNVAYIHLPRPANGTLTVSYNDVKDYVIDYWKGSATYYINAWELNHLGKNTLKFTYSGDDFGKMTATVVCIVQPNITAPEYVSVGEKFEISMVTHEWADGKFNVYDYNSGKKGKLLASGVIRDRLSSVTLSSDTVGLNRYYLEFDYPGGNYPMIREVNVIRNSENVTVTISGEVNVGDNVTVNVTAPATPYGIVNISIDGKGYESYDMDTGEVIRTFSGLSKGYHKISVKYDDETHSGCVYSNTFTVAVGIPTKITAQKVATTYNVGKNLVITLNDNKNNALVDKTVTVKLNGKTYTPKTDKNGQVRIWVNLPAKTYTAKISFAGDKNHMASGADAKVVVLKAKPKITAKSKTFKVKAKAKKVTATLKDNRGRAMKKVKLTLKVKGKKYTAKTNKKGVATFKVKLAKKGTYSAKIAFKANSNYKAASKTVKIKIK